MVAVVNTKSGAGIAATLTGTFEIGKTITATFPTGSIGTIQFTRTMLTAPFTKSNIAGAVAAAVSSLSYTLQPEDGGCSVDCDCSSVVSTSKGGVVPGFPAVTISASIRTQMPVTAGQFGTSPEQNWRVNDTALKPATNPRGFFTNNAVWASVDGPQEIANISPVIVTLAYLTGVDGTGNADQSGSTIAPPTWSNAANGVADYLFKDANLTPATAAEFVAAGGFISSDGYSIKFPPGWSGWHDPMTGVALNAGYAVNFALQGQPQLTLTITNAGTYAAGDAIAFTGTAPAADWPYLASGAGVTAPTANMNDATGTIATYSGGVLRLSKAFTATAGQTIQINSRFPGQAIYANASIGDATCQGAARKAVLQKNWTTAGGVTSVTQSSGGSYAYLAKIEGTNRTGATWNVVMPGDSIARGNHDQTPTNNWGNSRAAEGMIQRALFDAGIPSVRTAVSGTSPATDVKYGGNKIRLYLGKGCNFIVSHYGANARGLPWSGAAGIGFLESMRAWLNMVRAACVDGTATKSMLMSMPPVATGTFASAEGQTPNPDSINPTKPQMMWRALLLSGVFDRNAGDPDYVFDLAKVLYDDATSNGLSIVGADLASGKWPWVAGWTANGYNGSTLEGTHKNWLPQAYGASRLTPALKAVMV